MTFQQVKTSWFSLLILCLELSVSSGIVHEAYFYHFYFALLIHIRLNPLLASLWKDVSESKEFIPVVNPTWPILLTYFLWYAAILAVPLNRMEVFVPVAGLVALLLQPLITLLPPKISRLSRSGFSFYDTCHCITSRQPYNHQALPSEAHIRLVTLRGFLFWRDVQILAYPLNACPTYEAISYTWDNQEPTCPIVVNRGRLLVTRNARQILYDFTPACGQRMIWIDSICINQAQDDDSLAERAVQVGRMSEIYRRATAVRVWLSQPSVPETLIPESLDVLFKESLAEWIHEHLVSGVSFPRLHQRIFTLIALALSVIYISFLHPPTLSSGSLQHILSHDYWIRLWIIQEIAFGREVTIHLGPMYITWQSVSNFAHKVLPECSKDEYGWGITAWLGLHKFYDISPSDEVLRGLRQIKLITQLRSNISKGKLEDLLALLSLLFHTKARDPRDKVYGLLSLVQERRAGPDLCQDIQADYNLTTRTLYEGLAERYLTQTAAEFNARILLYAGVGWPRTVGGLPSWVPDWTSISMAHTRAFATETFDLQWSLTLLKCQGAFSFEGSTLKIAGCHVIDSISAKTQVIDHDDDSRRWFNEICDVVEGQLSYIPKKEIDLLGGWSWCYRRCPGRWRGAIFRVLIGDIESYWGEAPHQTNVTTFVRPDTFPTDIPGAGYENPNHADPRGGRIALEASYDEWLKLPHRQPRYPDTVEKEHPGCIPFVSLSRRKTQGLRFAVSQTGRMCLVPPETALGDKLMLSEHLRTPYLIRPMKGEKEYQLVGHCIALGLMGDRDWNHYNATGGVNPEGYNFEACKKEVITIY
ncbi:uncharacterized protein FMAN_10734 [Fusarium mangiferae]|uniref:Heterokaryon incompatibility domain-containing protein n=1 Tax=Fusarium mangiferae TaxID=192010 RepID=A0A1L7UE92_FUSMA|nr:uncharacterized protein FMAN_10734 [Fusarium mangiferae]CVL05446.1 uncharacterized protein FMAN_10734 [Fusarium mangiferae]